MDRYLRQLKKGIGLTKRSIALEFKSVDVLTDLLKEYVDPVAREYGYRGGSPEDIEPPWGKRTYKKDNLSFTVTLGYNAGREFAHLNLGIYDNFVMFKDGDTLVLNPRRLADARYVARFISYSDSIMRRIGVEKFGTVIRLPIPVSKQFQK